MSDTDDNSIPLETAVSWTTQWRAVESTYNSYNDCKGFLIPASDLESVLSEIAGQSGDKYVRAYLGVDPTTNKEKLIIVGTEPDDIKGGTVIYRDLITGYNGTGKMYDFTQPVPPGSDPASPLD